MDGSDISLVKTNGLDLQRLNKNYFYEYSNKTKDILLNTSKEVIKDLNFKKKIDNIITLEHFKALNKFDLINKSDLIGYHGQTIYHNPQKYISIQLGDAYLLAKLLNQDVVFDFRGQDINMGGQGAPIAPIYHKYIIEELNLDLPACIINIGGVANITYWDGKNLIGFDTGPGNALMDKYAMLISNNYFDLNGYMASIGNAKKEIVKNFLKLDFFKTPPPKSLDKNTFLELFNELLDQSISTNDIMATLAEFTIESILLSIKFLPNKPKNIIITGGGYKNNYLIKSLRKRLKIKIFKEKDLNNIISFDYIESELIAYLSARSIYNLPFTFPSTTGVSKPCSGGKLYKKPF